MSCRELAANILAVHSRILWDPERITWRPLQLAELVPIEGWSTSSFWDKQAYSAPGFSVPILNSQPSNHRNTYKLVKHLHFPEIESGAG